MVDRRERHPREPALVCERCGTSMVGKPPDEWFVISCVRRKRMSQFFACSVDCVLAFPRQRLAVVGAENDNG